MRGFFNGRWKGQVLVVLFIVLMLVVNGEVYDLPPIVLQSEEQMRLDEIHVIEEPRVKFAKVYKREIYTLVGTQNVTSPTVMQPFAGCAESPPEISFSYLGYASVDDPEEHKHKQASQKATLIYDYEELKSQFRNIVDMVYYNMHVFTISSTGVIKVYRVDERGEYGVELRDAIVGVDWMEIDKMYEKEQNADWTRYRNIGRGYFQFMAGNGILIFANGRVLICLDIRTLKVTLLSQQQTYDYLEDFQSVTKIDEWHFAVLDKKKGAFIYEIGREHSKQNIVEWEYSLKLVERIGRDKFGVTFEIEDMALVDIKYNAEKEHLILLDYEKGVFFFRRQAVEVLGQSEVGEQKYTFELDPNMILKKQCNMMELSTSAQTLYLVCNKIHRVSLLKWPIVQEKTYPHPMINIREVFIQEEQNIIVMAGYQVFKVLYLDRPTAYFHDDMLDKIVFGKDVAITANQNNIVVYNFEVEKPQIQCLVSNESMVGSHQIVIKTTANCQEEFLRKINRMPEQKSIFQPEDICVYTVYKSMYIWEQGNLPVEGLIIFLVVALVFIILMVIWYLTTMWRAKRAMAYLITLGGDTQVKLVQENAPRSQQYKENGNKDNQQIGDTNSQINKDQQLSEDIKSAEHV